MRLVLTVNGVEIVRMVDVEMDAVIELRTAAASAHVAQVIELPGAPVERVVYGREGVVEIPPDAVLCTGDACTGRGARGYYYPASGETCCGICTAR